MVASDFRFHLSPKLDALATLIVVANILLVAGGELVRRRAKGAVGMTRRLLIRGGEVTTAVDCWTGDILIEDGRIVALGAALYADAEIHDADGLLVLPGGVDVHTHIDYDTGTARTADTFETATRAAAFGGTTTVVDFAFQPRHSPSVPRR